MTLTFDLETFFSNAHLWDEYFWRVLVKSLH